MASQSSTSHIPPGFTCIVSPGGDKYLVPKYMVRTTKLAWQAERIKAKLAIDEVNTPVSRSISVNFSHAERVILSRGHPQMSRLLD